MTQPNLDPGAHPSGRYLISIAAVKDHAEHGHDVVVHDLHSPSENRERCNVDDIARADRSRFDDLQWALDKGYRPCEWCMPTPA